MSTSSLSPQDLRALASQRGNIIARRACGDAGPGLDLDVAAMEQIAEAAARGLKEGTLATLLEQPAHALAADSPCPDCGRPCPVGRESRSLVGRAGPLRYREPVCHCPACRRDFFPSTTGPAPRRPSLQPGPAGAHAHPRRSPQVLRASSHRPGGRGGRGHQRPPD